MYWAILANLLICATSLNLKKYVSNIHDIKPDEFGNPLYSSYEDYVESQDSKTSKILATCGVKKTHWVNEEDIQFLADYMKKMKLPFTNKFGLNHGTRCGFEQKWFMEALPDVKVLGTELSPEAKDFPNTIVWDFHEVKPEWEGKVDFVYSNALDHSYNPEYAVQQWMKEVSRNGVLVIEHTDGHTKKGLKGKIDIYGGTLQEFEELITHAGNYTIHKVLESPTRKSIHARFIIAQHA